MALPEAPNSRSEQYLAKIAGQTGPLPEAPRSRVEQYLDYIAENGTVSKEEIAEQVSTWLSENIHEDPTVAIDKSLSVESAAADAKAVGDEFSNAYEKISFSENIMNEQLLGESPEYSWEQGNINSSTGRNSTVSANRLRINGDSTNKKVITKNGLVVTVPSGLKIFSYKYSNDTMTQGYIGNDGKWFESGEHYFNDAPYYRFVAAFSDDTDITPTDASGIVIARKTFTDKTLTISNMAADAKVVGERFDLAYGQTEDYNILQYSLLEYSISDNDVWYATSLRHSIIPIDDGIRIVKIQASTNNAVIAFLTDSTVVEGETPAFASGETGRRVLISGTLSYHLVPTDAKYLFVYRGYTENGYANTPRGITGYKIPLSIDCIRAAVAKDGEPYGLVRDVPKNQGVRNAYKKMHQLLDIKYTTPIEIPSRSDMPPGNYTGVNYSGTADKAHYVGWNVSLISYVTALHNPYSGMYTEGTNEGNSFSAYGITYYGTNADTPLGVVCAPFVAYALGMDIKWENHAWPYLESIGVLEKIADQSYTGVELGDTIYQIGHVSIVSDIYRDNRGVPKLIYILESWSPRTKTTIYTPESFTEYMHGETPRTIYRYKDLYKNLLYQPSMLVAVDGEASSEPYVFNDDICPYLGDYSVYREGELIVICYTKGSYTRMIISKDGTDIHTISLPASSDVHHIDLRSYNLTAGSYTARLSNGSNEESNSAYFNIVSLPISVTENGDLITVEFDSNKDPRYVQICSIAGAARCVISLSDSDKSLGTKTFNIRTEITTQNSSVPQGTACYITVVYGTIDPAGYKLVRSSEFIPLSWID